MATASARYTARLTDAQKRAIVHAALVDGYTVADVIRMANRGELGLPAFHVQDGASRVYALVRVARREREAHNEDVLGDAVEAELRAAEQDALAHLRYIRRERGKSKGVPKVSSAVDDLRRAAADLAAIRKARKDAGVMTKASPKSGTRLQASNGSNHAANKPAASVLGELLAKQTSDDAEPRKTNESATQREQTKARDTATERTTA